MAAKKRVARATAVFGKRKKSPNSSSSASSNALNNPPDRIILEDGEMHRAFEAILENERKRQLEAIRKSKQLDPLIQQRREA